MERPLKSQVRDIIYEYDTSYHYYKKLNIYIVISTVYSILVIIWYL